MTQTPQQHPADDAGTDDDSAPDPTQMLTPEQAAEVLGTTPEQLAHWRATGIGPDWGQIVRTTIRYSLTDLHIWQRERRRHMST